MLSGFAKIVLVVGDKLLDGLLIVLSVGAFVYGPA